MCKNIDFEKFFDGIGEYIHPVHGRIIKQYFAPYHDVTVYEDGYEDWFYIGE